MASSAARQQARPAAPARTRPPARDRTPPAGGSGLRIGPPDDRYEREAERVADAVLAGTATPPVVGGAAPPRIQRLCSACQQDEDEEQVRRLPLPLQREALPGTEGSGPPALSRGRLVPGAGTPLPTAARSWFEPRLGRDLGGVRIHRGTQAASAAASVGARAFTLGRNVVFNHGEYDHGSSGGRRLIAHELAHVVQQRPDVVQRLPENGAPEQATPEPGPAPGPEPGQATEPAPTRLPGLIIEQGEPEGGQMAKAAWLAALREQVCASADAQLAGTGRDSAGCPYVELALRFYEHQSAERIERDLLQYAPETRGATSAADYLDAIAARVATSVATWRATGEVSGLPEGMPPVDGILALMGGGGGGRDGQQTDASGPLFAGREGGAHGPAGPATPQAVQARLGEGRPLATPVRRRMEGAFGRSFTGVRLHTDGVASSLANRYNARALTVGDHVAFGAGQYRPGSLHGDGLLAHELAHVIQQGSGSASSSTATTSLERDADRGAAGALLGLHGGRKNRGMLSRLRTGLRLQRCDKCQSTHTSGSSDSARPEATCCSDAESVGLDKGSAGGVLCCDGRWVTCAWPSNFTETDPDAVAIIKACVIEHEDAHHDDPGSSCPSTIPCLSRHTTTAVDTEECKSYKIERDCLVTKKSQCGSNATCKTQVQGRIDWINSSQKSHFGCSWT